MATILPTQSPVIFSRRRARLDARTGDRPAILFAGGPQPRNYRGNPHRFRASSHFLYLTGAQIPGAALTRAPGKGGWTLFVTPKGPDDALWHGVTPGFDEISAATGVAQVRPLSELPGTLADLGELATVPAVDPVTRRVQAELLARPWGHELGVCALGEADAALCDALVELRMIHDEASLELMRGAVAATREGHLAGMAATAPGVRESAIRAAIEAEFIARDMACAYGSIVTVHGEVLHNERHVHELRRGDLVLADAGAENAGWASDVTRTWPVTGSFSATQRALYDIVLQAQVEACDRVRPGARYRDIHLGACRTLARGLVDLGILRGDPDGLVERGAHAIFFPHGLGHLIGLDVHDMEDLGDRAGYAPERTRDEQFGLSYLRLDRDLEPGMAVTIEPGFYQVPAILDDPELGAALVADRTLDREVLARFADVRGIRIEDDVLCTAGDPEVLTGAIPKDPAGVEAQVGRS